MSDRLIVDIGSGKTELRPLSADEQAALDAYQADQTARRAADDVARAGIVYGNDAADITNLAVVQQYVQASRAFLVEASHTPASVAQQTERNTRAILALLRKSV